MFDTAPARSRFLPASGSATVTNSLVSAVIVCFSLFLRVSSFDQTEFAYNGFDPGDGEITCFQGSSFLEDRIQLTAVGAIQGMGRALYSDAVQFLESGTGAPVSFSSQFIFSINPGPEGLADGIAFVLSPILEGIGNSSQGLLGILSNATNGQSSSHTFAVEFDGYKNPEFEDMDDNHVGIDINSLVSTEAASAAFKSAAELTNAGDGYEIQLKGPMIQAWIDYDASKTELNVSVSRNLGIKPAFPLISNSSLDLSTVLKERMYVGFSASTGPLPDVLYYVYAWSFSNVGKSAPVSVSDGSRAKNKKVSIILGVVFGAVALLLILLGFVLVFLRRRKRQSKEWEVDSICLDHLPQKFSYRELSKATKGFHKEHLLGSGGFGSVYHGVLPSSGAAVAVKRISKESKQGVKEFVAEVSTIGRLRHRNLVPLLGWCQDQGFMLVYELMPNGSLDKLLFDNEENCLPWALRFKVLTGVASALVYLHEEWEQKIVHRDVKASNVMLDAEFNARLGDFGLARQSGHDAVPETTNVAGTWGYVAPEYFFTRRATEKTDVFSYGALMLEVATGRKVAVVEMEEGGSTASLIASIWRMRGREELEKAADKRLWTDFDADEMKTVLELGLLCCHSEPNMRPTMRRVLQILSRDVVPSPICATNSGPSSFAISMVADPVFSTSNAFLSSSFPFSSDSHILLGNGGAASHP